MHDTESQLQQSYQQQQQQEQQNEESPNYLQQQRQSLSSTAAITTPAAQRIAPGHRRKNVDSIFLVFVLLLIPSIHIIIKSSTAATKTTLNNDDDMMMVLPRQRDNSLSSSMSKAGKIPSTMTSPTSKIAATKIDAATNALSEDSKTATTTILVAASSSSNTTTPAATNNSTITNKRKKTAITTTRNIFNATTTTGLHRSTTRGASSTTNVTKTTLSFETTTTTKKKWKGIKAKAARATAATNASLVTTPFKFPPNQLEYQSHYERLIQNDQALLQELGHESFSACLLIKDENHRLSEWLAYHYLAMPLRHVVFMVDPTSTQNPLQILQKWQPLMNFTIWNSDAQFRFRVNKNYTSQTNHRLRQLAFLRQCLTHLKGLGKTWTSAIDVDEYLLLSGIMFPKEEIQERSKEPGFVLKLIQDTDNLSKRNTTLRNWIKNAKSSCVQVSRRAFGAKESSWQKTQDRVPKFLNSTKFETLRFRYRAGPRAKKWNGNGKSLVNAQYIPDINDPTNRYKNSASSKVQQRWGDVHQVMKPACHGGRLWNYYLLTANHYRGSLESYLSRVDARRDMTVWDWYQSKANDVVDDEIRPWIRTFVDHVGKPLAQYLLADAGSLKW